MEAVREIKKDKINKLTLEEDLKESCLDKDFVNIIKKYKITKEEAMKKNMKIKSVVESERNCHNCQGIHMCSNEYIGHVFSIEKKENRLYFVYKPCKYERLILEHNLKVKEKIHMKDIDTIDKKQLKIIKWLDKFYEDYSPLNNQKGLYLHGSFGSGKTYLITALLNELNDSKKVSVEIIYFPEVLRSLKEDFETFGYKMNKYMNTDILFIDDIGAEKVTDWGRDEVLGTILQYRMDKQKTTFFTSNLTIEELEEHLSLTKNSVDKVKARRIIERIKQLTIDLELVSENRRV